MSARREIRPALERLVVALQRRGYGEPDVALLRVLRDFGVECHALGVQHAHAATTIPAPAEAPDAPRGDGPGDTTGRYLISDRAAATDRTDRAKGT